MRLTKYEHSCIVVESDGKKLFIDPGSFTPPVVDTENTVAVVITHEHADHWTSEQLNKILITNPEARIFGPAGVARSADQFDVSIVTAGDTVMAGPFVLRFFGGRHALIHRSIPVVDNVGVLVNDTVYHPGDSFYVPEGIPIDVLGVPVAAPWSKVSEVMDFVETAQPHRSFPLHEMVLSEAGKTLTYARVQEATETVGGKFFALTPHESLEL